MKVLVCLAALLIIQSCVDAEKIRLSNSFVKEGPYRANQITGEEDPSLRDASIVVFPNQEDVDPNFSIDVDYQTEWDPTINFLAWGHKIPYNGVRRSDDPFTKAKIITRIIMAVGDVRDKAFKRDAFLNNKVNKIKKVNRPLIKEEIKKFPCFQLLDPKLKRKCRTKFVAGVTKKKASKKFPSNCRKFKKKKKKFMEMTEAEESAYNNSIKICDKLDKAIKDKQDEIADEVEQLEYISSTAKSLAFAYLEALETPNIKFLGKVATKKDPDDSEGKRSFLKFNANKTAIQQLQLAIDFADGTGYQIYSLEKGNITNLEFKVVTRQGDYGLEFVIHHRNFTLFADLSMTVREFFGVRFIGETEIHYKGSGEVRSGGMRIELDLIDPNKID